MHIRDDVFSSLTAALGLSPQGGQAIRTGHAHHGHHHGEGTRSERAAQSTAGENPIMQALAQALESLGLSLSRTIPPTGTATSATTGATSSTASAAAPTASATTTPSASATQSTPAASSTPAAQSTPAGTASNSTPVAAPAATDGDDDGASGFVSIARDVRHLLHALFQDIRAENVLAPAAAPATTDPAASATVPASSTGTTTAAAPTSPFASGLAALISQVSSGSVPANLQDAFDKLVADLQQIGGVTPTSASSTGTASTSAPSTAASSTSTTASSLNPASTSGSSSTAASGAPANSSQALLLKFLTTLQQDLGYGTAASTGSTTNGLVVNTIA